MIFTSSLSYFVVVCSTDSTFFTSTKGWKNLEKYFLSYISVFFCKCYEGIYWRNLSLLQVKLPPNPSIPRQSITFSPLKQLLEVECGCYLKIFCPRLLLVSWDLDRFFNSMLPTTVQPGGFLCSLCLFVYVHGLMILKPPRIKDWPPLVTPGLLWILIQSRLLK